MRNVDAVRVAALRTLMRSAAAPIDGVELDEQHATVARLLVAGYDLDDICAALAIEPTTAHGIVIRLAR